MNFETWQDAWQKQPVTKGEDEKKLLDRIKQSSEAFDVTIRNRDRREVSVAIVCSILFALSARNHGWPYLFAAFQALALVGFIVIDRRRQHRRSIAFDQSLLRQIERAIELNGHQIKLLKNVFWWYILPVLVSLFLIRLHRITDLSLAAAIAKLAPGLLFDWVLAGSIYWLNQRAVRKNLLPRQTRLIAVREQLLAVGETNGSSP